MLDKKNALIKLALETFDDGNLEESKKICLGILEDSPNIFIPNYILGIIYGSVNDHHTALEYFKKALAIEPNDVYVNFNVAKALFDLKEVNQSIGYYLKALNINPEFAEAWCNIGNAYLSIDLPDSAMHAYERAIALSPNFLEPLINKSIILRGKKLFQEARDCLLAAKKISPHMPELWLNFGLLSLEIRKFKLALQQFNKSLQQKEDLADAWFNRGLALQNLGEYNHAVQSYLKAISYDQNREDYFCNLGTCYIDLKLYSAAIGCFDKSISINKNYHSAYWNKSLVLLLLGDYSEGWKLYEHRLYKPEYTNTKLLDKYRPLNIEDLFGKKILVIHEQGYGDTIQFSRYLPALTSISCVTFLVSSPLNGLFHELPKVNILSDIQDTDQFDLTIPLLSLPLIFKTTIDSIPCASIHIKPNLDKVKFWSEKLSTNQELRIGIAISGNPNQSDNTVRSIPAKHIQKLTRLGKLYVIQKGMCEEDLSILSNLPNVEYLGDKINDFSDTAAIIMNMDVIVSVCTSIVHLAGTLNKETILMCRYAPDWRWMLDRCDSPWYPSIKIYRQNKIDDWSDVVQKVYDYINTMQTNKVYL